MVFNLDKHQPKEILEKNINDYIDYCMVFFGRENNSDFREEFSNKIKSRMCDYV